MSALSPPFEPRLRRASLALRLGILVQCAVLAWLALRHGTALNAWIFMELGQSEATAILVDRLLGGLALAAALALCVRPFGSAALVVGLVFALQALAIRLVGGRAFSELAPLAQATRWIAPLALLPLALVPARPGAARWVLRIAVAATYLAHGWQALGHHPAFVDLLLGTARRWTGSAPTEATARVLLTFIGGVDMAIAFGLLVTRWRWIAAWATLWGFVTLTSRSVALGTEFAHESLIRAMNGLAPLALWFLTQPFFKPTDPAD